MKKNNYQKPAVKTVMLQQKSHILEGSGTRGSRVKYTNGSQDKALEEKDVNGNWVWD